MTSGTAATFRAAVVIAGLVAICLFVVIRLRERNDRRAHRERIAIARAAIDSGSPMEQVNQLLGGPTFLDDMSDFRPEEPDCRGRSARVFVYPLPPEPTLLVFFDVDGRVTCVETTPNFP